MRMDVMAAIRGRRTVHLYQNTAIEPAILREALEAALLAPNHKLTYPWKFVVVGPKTREALFVLGKKLKMARRESSMTHEQEQALEATLRQKITNPAGLVAFCVRRHEDDFRQREDYATVCCGIQNFTLALTAHGYGTKWSTGKLTRSPETYEILGVAPERYEIIGFLWVGHSAAEIPPQKRPLLEEALEELP